AATVIVFVCDVKTGMTASDQEVADLLLRSRKPVVLAVNKCDNPQLTDDSVEFTKLGFDEIISVSCMHSTGIKELISRAMHHLDYSERNGSFPVTEDDSAENNADSEADDADAVNTPVTGIAVIGRPNVGKSSLINALLGRERVIVSDVAGTTRDSIDIGFSIAYSGGERLVNLIDTAGLRKKAKVKDLVEYFSVMRTESAIKRAKLVLFLVECDQDGVTAQDRKIASMITEAGRACIIVANKWDICKSESTQKKLLDEIRYTLPGLSYAPVIFTSAKERYNLDLLLDQVVQILDLLEVRIPTSLVNQVIKDAYESASPPVIGAAPLKIYYSSMVSSMPPKFLLFVNEPKYCADNYIAYLKRYLRQSFDFTGQPLEIELRARPKKVASFHTERTPGGAKRASTSKLSSRPGTKKRDEATSSSSKRSNGKSSGKPSGARGNSGRGGPSAGSGKRYGGSGLKKRRS
ncbi:MAG: ribosome biogenesis GTPase Der, partial [Victivallaceae bacterium]